MDPKLIDHARDIASACRIFSHDLRILIVWSLYAEEKSVGEIAEEIGSSIQNTSQHLRLMVDKGILCSRRDGRHIYYRVSDQQFPISFPTMLDQQQIIQFQIKENKNV